MLPNSRAHALRVLLLTVCAALAVAFAACGGSDDDTGETADGTPASQSESASSGSGGQPKATGTADKTIAFINITRACESCVRAEAAFEEAADMFGWKVRIVDGQGDPNRISDQFNTLLESGVDGIVMQSVDPAIVGDGLVAAEKKGVPVIDQALGGAFDGAYFDKGLTSVSDFNAAVESGLISEAFFAEIDRRIAAGDIEGKAKIMVFSGLPSLGIHRMRYAAFKAFLAENKDKVEVVGTHATDLSKIQADVRNTMDSVLTANPDLAAVWTVQSPEALPAVEAIRAAGAEDQAFLTSFFGDKGILEDIRNDGTIYATVDAPLELTSYQSVDSLLKFFSGKTPSQRPSLTDVTAVPLVYTKDNAPAEGEPTHPSPQIDEYVETWKSEYLK